ncbi:unnamed protein product [Thelazia callipaeda]|uniref:Decapping nuclease n=1 Tax=Thelazia callipaeda TaxID=103827 RepID=A0A0N5D740_THECL|nr:unnamed protein product [Thelazia callipaeda]
MFLATDSSLYQDSSPEFEEPTIIGEMFVDKNRDIMLGRSRLRYLYEGIIGKRCMLDLNRGFERFQSYNQLNEEKLDVMLKWILKHSEPGTSLAKVCHDADFVSNRGCLSRLAATPYETQDDWQLCFVRFKSVIFVCEFSTDRKVRRIQSASHRERLMTFWGHKFEQYVTHQFLTDKPKTDEPVSNLEEFRIVVKTRIKKRERFRLLYSAETDCTNADGNYVELKTSFDNFGGTFREHKSRKWWIQSFLAGIKNIVTGFRDRNGFVTHVGLVNVSDLPYNAPWSSNVILNFFYAALDRMKELLSTSPDLTYYLLIFDPSERSVTYEVCKPDSEFNFLPDWFVSHFDK